MTINKAYFKYDSLAHVNYYNSSTILKINSEDLAFMLSENFRNSGGTVIDRKKVSSIPVKSNNSDTCWEANQELTDKEFEIFSTRSYSLFKSLDNDEPFLSRDINIDCKIYEFSGAQSDQAFLLVVDFPAKGTTTSIYQPTLNSFFITNGTQMVNGLVTGGSNRILGIKAFSRMRIWIWPESDGVSRVFMVATPVSNGIEAGGDAQIGVLWWNAINGRIESNLVRSYILLFEEYARKIEV
jgi:hypothetical protein